MNFTRSSSETMTSFQATLVNVGYGQLALRDDLGKIAQKWTLAQPKCVIGTAANCNVRCMLPGIVDHHVLLVVGVKQLFLRALAPALKRDGQAISELLLTPEHDVVSFEIAGHRFEYTRQNHTTPMAKAFLQDNQSTDSFVAQGASALAAPKVNERLKFTFVRALEKNRGKQETARSIDSDTPMSDRPGWVEELVRDALRPVESRLDDIAAPLQNIQRRMRLERIRARKARDARRITRQSAHTAGEVPAQHLAEPSEAIQKIVADQTARLELVDQHVTDLVKQLAALERVVSAENDQYQAVVDRSASSGEEIIRLQHEMLALVNSLQSRVAEPSTTNSNAENKADLEWRESVQRQLEELHDSLAVLDEIKASVQMAVDQNRELTQDLELRWQTIEEVARRPIVIQSAPAPAAVPMEASPASPPAPSAPASPALTAPSAASAVVEKRSYATPYAIDASLHLLNAREAGALPMSPTAVSAALPAMNQFATHEVAEAGFVTPELTVTDEMATKEIMTSRGFDSTTASPAASSMLPVAQQAVESPASCKPYEKPQLYQPIDAPSPYASSQQAIDGGGDWQPQLAQGNESVCDELPTSGPISAQPVTLPSWWAEDPVEASVTDADNANTPANYSYAAEFDPVQPESDVTGAESTLFAPIQSPADADTDARYLGNNYFESSPENDSPCYSAADDALPAYLSNDLTSRTEPSESRSSEAVPVDDYSMSAFSAEQLAIEPLVPPQESSAEELTSHYQSQSHDLPKYESASYESAGYEEAGYESAGYEEAGYEAAEGAAPGYESASYQKPDESSNLAASSYDSALYERSDDDTLPHTDGTLNPNPLEAMEDEELARAANSAALSEVAREAVGRDVPEEGGDESVEDYMRRLLARMRGVSENDVTLPGLDTAAPRRSEPAVAMPSTVDFPETTSYGTEPVSESWTAPFDPDKYVPRGSAPERNRDLNALRELANNSARSAIQVSARRRHGTAILIKSSVAMVGLIAGIAMISINGARINVAFIATITSFLVALIWGYDALSTLRPLLQASNHAKPREAATAKPTEGESE